MSPQARDLAEEVSQQKNPVPEEGFGRFLEGRHWRPETEMQLPTGLARDPALLL